MRVGEKRMLKHMLSRTTNAEENLRLRLFELLEGGGNIDEAVKPLMASTSKSSFSHLKGRLKEDILSVLLVKESSKRIAQANRAAQFECVKKIAQAYILIFRGAKKQGATILRSAEQLAIKYELSAELVSIHHITREALFTFTDGKQLNEVNASIRNGVEKWRDILRSEELSFLLTLPQLKSDLLLVEEEGFENDLIDELKQLYEKSEAARIGFWYYMADVENSIEHKRFDHAIEQGLKFLKLVEKSPAIRSRNNMAGVNQSLGFAYLNLRNYAKSRKHLKQSELLFPSAGFNRLQCLQFLFQAEIAVNRLDKARETLTKAISHPRIEARESLKPRWLFLKACLHFLEGDVNAAFKTLNQDGYLVRQQDEWNIQFRLLEMMILIERNDEEWLEFKLDSTRKYLTRYKTLNTPRVRTAIDLISNLLRKNFDFKGITEKNLAQLKLCLEEKEGYEWNPAGVEMVRFDFWLQKKLPTQEAE